MELKQDWQKCREELGNFINTYFQQDTPLVEAMLYTLRQGKKFRPFLSYATALALQKTHRPVLAFAAAVEMVHAFSLIHDDLPALDNDDFRRGIATNHKVYGEAVAILAGDALLNEAFSCIATMYRESPQLALRLIHLLSEAVGSRGMIEGQVQDLAAQDKAFDYPSLRKVHELKTGALISVAVVGAALISGASEIQITSLKVYSEALGLAFQIADDVIEAKEGKVELGSYVGILGLKGATEKLHEASEMAIQALKEFPSAHLLIELVKENQNRNF